MKNWLIILLFTSLTLFANEVNATNYYFSSSSGNDSYTSTQAQNQATPWKTLSKLNSFFSSLKPGDSILFLRGDTFYGSITITKSGTSAASIIFGAYGTGANPIVTGLNPISSWTSLGSNLYSSVIANGLNSLNMVVVNGTLQPIGRWPKTSASNGGYLTVTSTSNATTITSTGLSGALSYLGGQIVIRKQHWILDRETLSTQTGTTVTFTNNDPAYVVAASWGFFFQNHVNACTTQGDWAYNSGTNTITMYSSSTPTGVQVATIDSLVNIPGQSYISFNNISFVGANSNAFTIINASHISINSCIITLTGINGIDGSNGITNYLTLKNSTISYTNNNSINAHGGTYWDLENNLITNSGTNAGMGQSSDGQYIALTYIGSNSTVKNNEFGYIGYTGIYFTGTNINIQNNYVHDFCSVKDDGGGIYTYNNNNLGTVVSGNIVLNAIGNSDGAVGAKWAEGIYMDDGTNNVTISGNTVANGCDRGIYIHNSHEIQILNNTSYNNNSFQIQFYHDNISSTNPIANINLKSNCFAAKTASQTVLGFSTISNDILNFGNADSNYYARPVNEPTTLSIPGTSNTLASWQAYSSQDVHTKKSPKTITDTSQLKFVYNATSSNSVINLGATYIGIDSTIYAGTITLAPYTSKVLIYVSGVVANQPPVANAGPDQSFFLPTNSTLLSGSGTDADGTVVSYQWTKISGPSQFTIVSPTLAQTTLNNLVQGVYQFQLTVTDNLGATGSDTVMITVNPATNKPPVANAGPNQNITLPTNSVTLIGSGSDSSGTITSYQWTKISGPAQFAIVSPTQAQTTIASLVQGVYVFQLKVIDNLGDSGTATVTVTVNTQPNIPPVANAGPNQNITLPTNTVSLTGIGTDSLGTVASYQWTKISGPTQFTIGSPTQAQTVINNLVQGVYQFQLTVTNSLGSTGTSTVTVTVNPAANIPPVANAGANQNITLPTNTVTLTGIGTDADGTVASYQWTKISGPTQYTIVSPTQAQTVINNLVRGVYQFQLTVTDNLGATGKDTVVITVNAPPVANAGPNQNITLPTNSVTLIGSGTDSSGTITSYQWTKISGPTQFTIVSPTQSQTTITTLVQGVYMFQLKITDNLGDTGTATVTVTVNPAANIPPVANAGANQNITLPTNTVTLTGIGTDADGTVASYQWTKISGPAQYTIVSPTQAQTVINNLVQGVYQLQLTVTDNLGATGTSTVTVTVNPAANIPPVANAGANQNITLPTNTVTLTGIGTDADGTVASYQWTKISGPAQYTIVSPTQAQTVINNLVQGVYQFQLTVTDNLGATGISTVTVTVNPAPNIPPVANAGANQNITLPTNTVTLTGIGTDADGTVASYQWTKISGPAQFTIVSSTSAQTVINNLVQGVYQFQLTVTDNLGATGTSTVTITVNPAANIPPVANAGANQNITLPTNTVTLTGSGTDVDGTIASYQWTKISGPAQFTIVSPTSAQTVIKNLVQGVYQFQLTVTDNLGATGTSTVTVTVNPAPILPPVANAGPDQNITLPTNSVTLNGSGTDSNGTITSYQWTKISGPAQFAIVSPSQAQTIINNLVQGVYQFQLTVTNNAGATASDNIIVTVNAAPIQPPVANTGPDQSITLPTNSVTLNGSGTDSNGTITSYQWTKISGPAQFMIVSPSQAQTIINNLVQGVYQFQLTVTNNAGVSASDIMTVTVNAAPIQPPVANAGPDQNITLPTNTVTLTGSGTDSNGIIVSYQWTEISGPSQYIIVSPTQTQTVINNLIQGVYQFQLTVINNAGDSATDTMSVTVNAAPIQLPVANAGPDQNITLPTDSATLNGSGSDVNGTITSYQWTKISGPSQYTIATPTQAPTVINNLVQGVYQFQLTVTNNAGSTGSDTVSIIVNAASPPPNQPPVANAGPDQVITLPVNSVTFTGSATDSNGTIVSYRWSYISGPSQFGIVSPRRAQTSVNNLVQGVYQFQLTVTDNLGATGTDTVMVTVNPAPIQPPVANAGADQNITLPTNTATLTGSGIDVNGTIVSYQWTQISGPSQFTIVSPTQAQTIINNLIQGVYQFQLTVTNNVGDTASDIMTVIVNPAPIQPPVANAGQDQNITLPTNTLTLTGSGTDINGVIVSYQWTKISGPAQFTIISPAQAQTVINNLVQGVYQFQLTVTNNDGETSSDNVVVTVNAAPILPPVGNAGADQIITLPINSVTLTGSGTDSNGVIVSYQWTKISGPAQFTIISPTQAQTIINNLTQGVYQFQLTVTNNAGVSASDAVIITVNAANQPPVANAGPDMVITLPVNSITLKGSATDPDGTIVSYQWTEISGPSQYLIVSPSQAQTFVNNLVQGVYKFQLTVTDNLGATGSDIAIVTVNPDPQPPVANAGTDQTITLPTDSVTLSGSGTDANGTIISYQWTNISGPAQFTIVSPTSAQTVINNLVQGVYQFQLTVTDNLGATGTDTVMITVNAANPLPVVTTGPDQIITLPTDSTTVTGNGDVANGIIVSYQWTMISGPGQFTIVSPNQPQTIISNLTQGVYQFALTVTDNSGMSATDSVQVTVVNNQLAPASTAIVYPNPASQTINIQINGATHENLTNLSIYNSAGVLVYQEQFMRSESIFTKQINISNLASGIYFIQINLDINTTTTLEFVKQ